MNLMAYQEFGHSSQPKLIILHGFLGSKQNWITVAKQLSDHYHVYTLDLRNHGSSFHDERHSYSNLVEDLLVFIEKFKLFNVTLMGHSMGGKVVMKFTCQYPALVDKTIVVDMAPEKYSFNEIEINAMLSLDLSVFKNKNEAEDRLSEFVSDLGMRRFLMTNLLWSEQMGFYWRANLKILSKSLHLIGANPLVDKEQCHEEVLFVMGEKSVYTKNLEKEVIIKYFPQARIEVIKGAGHNPHFTHREEFCKKILSFSL